MALLLLDSNPSLFPSKPLGPRAACAVFALGTIVFYRAEPLSETFLSAVYLRVEPGHFADACFSLRDCLPHLLVMLSNRIGSHY